MIAQRTLQQQLSDAVLLGRSIAGDLHQMADQQGAKPRQPYGSEPHWQQIRVTAAGVSSLYVTEQTLLLLFLVANQEDAGLYTLRQNGVSIFSWRLGAAGAVTRTFPLWAMAAPVITAGLPLDLATPGGHVADAWLAVVSRAKDT